MTNAQTLDGQVTALIRERDALRNELDSASRMIDLLRQQYDDISHKHKTLLREQGQAMADLEAERDRANQRAELIHGILMNATHACMQGLRAWKGEQQAAQPPQEAAEETQGAVVVTPPSGAANVAPLHTGANHPMLRRAIDGA